ncbi:MAG: carboxymuconolactone decarboxylase family protein [Actinomycetota bacterium]
MRLDKPRVEPLDPADLDAGIRERFGDGPILNIFRTLARHPKLMTRWLVFGNHVLAKSTLPPRERELVILRIGWLCQAGYEWGQHVLIGRDCGLTDEEIERIADGPDAPGWDDFDRVLLRATDELHADAFISDDTWAKLTARYSTEQCMDLVFAVGQYNLVSMALNTLGVQPENGAPKLPER